jgi:hypothetical protein
LFGLGGRTVIGSVERRSAGRPGAASGLFKPARRRSRSASGLLGRVAFGADSSAGSGRVGLAFGRAASAVGRALLLAAADAAGFPATPAREGAAAG